VEAFNASPFDSGFSQHQNAARQTADASTKLDAASLAVSFEEDLALTRQIIMDHQARSVTVSKEQFVQQMEELVKPVEEIVTDTVDLSVPYDAAARLAYESLEDKSTISFDAFRTQYLANAVAMVKSKRNGEDVSIPVTTDDAATTNKPLLKRVVKSTVSLVTNMISKN
jgi:hypothetical protein